MKLIPHSHPSTVEREERAGQWVYVKQYLNHHESWDVNVRRVKQEFDVLRRASQVEDRPRYIGLMVPLSCDPQKAEIVLAAVNGIRCDAILGATYAKYPQRTRLTVAWLCGRWLRWFQQHVPFDGSSPQRDHIIQEFGQYCKIRIDRCRYFLRQSAAERSKLVDLLEALITKTPAEQLRTVWLHGDYAPFNILWDGHKITPIDFATLHPGIALLDATYFIHRMQMQRVYRPWLRLPVPTLTKAFWRGYSESFDRSSALFTACMIKHYLCRLLNYEVRYRSTPVQRIHSAWVRWVVQLMLMSLVHQAKRLVKSSETYSQLTAIHPHNRPCR